MKLVPTCVAVDHVRWSACWSDLRGAGCRIGPLNGELAHEPFSEKLVKRN